MIKYIHTAHRKNPLSTFINFFNLGIYRHFTGSVFYICVEAHISSAYSYKPSSLDMGICGLISEYCTIKLGDMRIQNVLNPSLLEYPNTRVQYTQNLELAIPSPALACGVMVGR